MVIMITCLTKYVYGSPSLETRLTNLVYSVQDAAYRRPHDLHAERIVVYYAHPRQYHTYLMDESRLFSA